MDYRASGNGAELTPTSELTALPLTPLDILERQLEEAELTVRVARQTLRIMRGMAQSQASTTTALNTSDPAAPKRRRTFGTPTESES